MKDVVLNDWDENEPEDDEPEDGSLVSESSLLKGIDHVYADPLFAPDDSDADLDAPYSLTETADGMDAASQVLKSETYNNSGSGISDLDAIFTIPVLGPSATPSAVEVAGLGLTGSGSSNASCGLSSSTATGSNSPTNSIVLTLHHTEEIVEVEPEPIRDFSKLNRSNWQELDANADLLFPGQHYQLRTIKRKTEYQSQRFPDAAQYIRQSSLLILSLAGRSADKYSKCCVPVKAKQNGLCHLHKFCSCCSWMALQMKALTYVPAFDKGTWHFLTGSFKGKLEMTTPASAHDWLHYWEAYKFGLKALVQAGDIRGVFWTEELALLSMLPVKVQPHVHCIIEADEVGEAVVLKLQQLVSQYLGKHVEEPNEPDIEVEGISNKRSLYGRLRYMIKPIDLVKPYDFAWPTAAADNRSGAQVLNSQITDLVQGYSHVTTDRRKLNALGNLDTNAKKSFIGIYKKDHDKYRAELKRIKKQTPEYVDMGEPEEISLTA